MIKKSTIEIIILNDNTCDLRLSNLESIIIDLNSAIVKKAYSYLKNCRDIKLVWRLY